MNNLKSLFRKNVLNFFGKRLNGKFVVFESDDWGSERIPSKKVLGQLDSLGAKLRRNPFNYLDSLETEDDLSALFNVLTKYKDKKGNHPVITANSVVTNPDFNKIKESGFKKYFFEIVTESYKNKKDCNNSFRIIQEGINIGVYQPQFHGREHVNVNQWLSALQSGDRILLSAFEKGIYGIDVDNTISKRDNFMAAFDGINEFDKKSHEIIIKEGTSIFKELYGFNSKSFIAPCYVWHPSLEKVLKEHGIEYFQGLPVQMSPHSTNNYKNIYHYQGQKNNLKQRYFVRNCFFEPSLNPGKDLINECIERLKIIFFWGKPAIIGTHRINFAGTLDENNRKNNLKQLSDLLKTILKLWPDVEFISTDQLGELY